MRSQGFSRPPRPEPTACGGRPAGTPIPYLPQGGIQTEIHGAGLHAVFQRRTAVGPKVVVVAVPSPSSPAWLSNLYSKHMHNSGLPESSPSSEVHPVAQLPHGRAHPTTHTCTAGFQLTEVCNGRNMVTSLSEGLTEHRQLIRAQAPQPRRQLHVAGVFHVLPEQLLLALEGHLVRILPLHADVRI